MTQAHRLILFTSIIFALAFSSASCMNDYQKTGSVVLTGLKAPVTILRDEKGMGYIRADQMDDAIMAQGFITAQDRLFQMELNRRMATGQISEVLGENGKESDIKMRTLGFYRHAKKHARFLDQQSQRFIQRYIDGVNAYIGAHSKEHPLEFKLMGIQPRPWNISDSLAIMYYMGWATSANLNAEVIAQMLIEKLGEESAKKIFPLNINPDDPSQGTHEFIPIRKEFNSIYLASDEKLMSFLTDSELLFGSNNWVVGPQLSKSGKPIVANDPHVDTRILPGPFYPVCMITPDFKAVGVSIPGIPGIIIGRNEHTAFGITNAYGDTQDLYLETLDPKNPDRYIEGKKSILFNVVEETITIKDKTSPKGYRNETLRARQTKRGPVISDILPGLETQKVITVRWSPFEKMDSILGLDRLLVAKTVKDIRNALRYVNIIVLNFVFADKEGNLGWLVSGRFPVRSAGDGTIPFVVKDDKDNWTGWVPFDEKPQRYTTETRWIGTCNHKTVSRNYPYYYSSLFAPSYRYKRLKELFEKSGKTSVNDHWKFQRDVMNISAREIAPKIAQVLLGNTDTQEMGRILSEWDFRDDSENAAPTIFQAVYHNFAFLVFRDELGDTLTKTMLSNWYFWQERLGKMVNEGYSSWFDDIKTDSVEETMEMLLYQAALNAKAELGSVLGENPRNWRWGKVHRLEFVSPIRRKGFGKRLLGGGSYPAPGSGETLCRGRYNFNDPYKVTASAAVRMVADLGDDEKVLAVLSGGVCGRLFHPHTKDQIKAFMNGEIVNWWFSDQAIKNHSKDTLKLLPS